MKRRKYFKKAFTFLELIISLIILGLLILASYNYAVKYYIIKKQETSVDAFFKASVSALLTKIVNEETFSLCPFSSYCDLTKLTLIKLPSIFDVCYYYNDKKIECTLKSTSSLDTSSIENLPYLSLVNNKVVFDMTSENALYLEPFLNFYVERYKLELEREIMLYNMVRNYYLKYKTLPNTNVFLMYDAFFSPYKYIKTKTSVKFVAPMLSPSPTDDVTHTYYISEF